MITRCRNCGDHHGEGMRCKCDLDKLVLTLVEKVKILREALLRCRGTLSDIHAADDDGSPEMREMLGDIDDVLIRTRRKNGESA